MMVIHSYPLAGSWLAVTNIQLKPGRIPLRLLLKQRLHHMFAHVPHAVEKPNFPLPAPRSRAKRQQHAQQRRQADTAGQQDHWALVVRSEHETPTWSTHFENCADRDVVVKVVVS